uniref:Ig-like domain-containing protein n=1 Tax=Fundulus heteroclitus TaxID=8078 RepID=A0A3Q2PAR6_FUNHE
MTLYSLLFLVCFSYWLPSLNCEKSTVVSGTEGHMLDFRCEYPDKQKNNSKYFCCFYIEESFAHLVHTSKHNEWTRKGRVSLYDNTTAGFFIVKVDKLYLNDSGTYWCGADGNDDRSRRIYLNVSRGTVQSIGHNRLFDLKMLNTVDSLWSRNDRSHILYTRIHAQFSIICSAFWRFQFL